LQNLEKRIKIFAVEKRIKLFAAEKGLRYFQMLDSKGPQYDEFCSARFTCRAPSDFTTAKLSLCVGSNLSYQNPTDYWC